MLYNEGSRRIQRDGTPEKDAGMMLRRMWTVSVCHLKMHEFGRSGERKLMTEISTSPQTALLSNVQNYHQTFTPTVTVHFVWKLTKPNDKQMTITATRKCMSQQQLNQFMYKYTKYTQRNNFKKLKLSSDNKQTLWNLCNERLHHCQ